MRKGLTTFLIKFCALVVITCLSSNLSFAQSLISGTVTDASSGDPLVGASVVVKGTTNGTLTSDNGSFRISASQGNVLTISYVGYVSQEVTVTSATTYNVGMKLGTLDEVVITGYTAQSKANVSGSVAAVEVEELKTLPVGNVEAALQGRVAGVTVSTSGVPGSASLVRIRGFGTVNSNQPLYIIDGLPVQGGIIELNPNDIKEMTVLKDASAASIYGSRASNGVIIITTKNGSVGGKSTVTFDASIGSQYFNNFPDFVTPEQLANLENWEKPTNLGQPTGSPIYGNGASAVIPNYLWPIGANSVNEDEYFYSTDLALWNGITRTNPAGTDWFDEIFDPGLIQNYNVSATGGNQGAQYAIAIGHLSQEGHRIYSGFERTNIRANGVFRINENLRIGQNLTVAYSEESGNRQIQGAQSIIDMASRQPGIIPVYDISGVNFSSNKGLGSASNNPVQQAFNSRDDINTKVRALASAYLEWDIIDGLTAKTSFATDFANSDFRSIGRAVPNDSEPRLGNSLNRGTNQVLNWTWYNTLTYSKTFNDVHDLNVLVGTEAIQNNFKQFGATRIQFLLEDVDFMVLNSGPPDGQNTNGFRSESTLFSQFGKIDYAYAGKYLLSATLRRDGSSVFGPNNRYAVFPAFSAGWRISDEDFFNSSFINELKLRGGWGKTGNQNINSLAQFTLYTTADIVTASYAINGGNNSVTSGIQASSVGNPDLKWEETTDINVGLDAALLNNSITVAFDLYRRNTTDLLLGVPPSTLLGQVGSQFRNIGEVQN
ncbi:MAG: SusC/RagA family TonB-linked outer membrane protein, partial [Bacteroidota bacterium]